MKPAAGWSLVVLTLLCHVQCQLVEFVENDIGLKNFSTKGLLTTDSGWSPDDGGQLSGSVQFLPISVPVSRPPDTQPSQNGRRTRRQAYSDNNFNSGGGTAWRHEFSISSVNSFPTESTYIWDDISKRLKNTLEKGTEFDFLYPRGLRISIAADNINMRIEDFRVKLNEVFRSNDGGQYAPTSNRRGGYWLYDLPELKVHQGDKVYYLMIVTFIKEGTSINVNGVLTITEGNPHRPDPIPFRPRPTLGPRPQPSYGGGVSPTFGGGLGGGMTGPFSWNQQFNIAADYGSGFTQNSVNIWQQQAELLKKSMEKIDFKFSNPTGLMVLIPDSNINMRIVDFRLKRNEEFGINDGGHYKPDGYKRGGFYTYNVPQLTANQGDRVYFLMRVKLGKEEFDTIVKGVLTISQGGRTPPSTFSSPQPNTRPSAGGGQGGSTGGQQGYSWYHRFNINSTLSIPFTTQESSNSWMAEAELFKNILKDIKFQFLNPTGLSISIAGGNENVKILAFNVKLNEEFRDLGPGQFVANGTQLSDGRWYYYYPNLKLNQGDKIYYWMRVTLGKQAFDSIVKGELEVKHGNPHVRGPIADQITPAPYQPSTSLPNPNPPPSPSYSYNQPSLPDPNPPPSLPNPNPPPPPSYSSQSLPKPNPPPTPPYKNPQTSPICQPSQSSAKTNGATSSFCQGNIMYQFNNLGGWTHQISIGGINQEDEFTCFTNYDKNIWEQQGSLNIKPTLLKDRYSDYFVDNGLLELPSCTLPDSGNCRRQANGFAIIPPVESARISTQKSFAFRYGTVEIRAKLPRGDWLVPELRLEPTNSAVKEKIVIGLSTGNALQSNRLDAGVVRAGDDRLTLMNTMGSTPWFQGSHTFKLEWTPERAKFFVDNRKIGELSTSSFTVLREEVYISIGVHAGSHEDFPKSLFPKRPWEKTDLKRMAKFWSSRSEWYPTWTDTTLRVEYIKVSAL